LSNGFIGCDLAREKGWGKKTEISQKALAGGDFRGYDFGVLWD
jgi:hypothetical protein